MKGFEKKHVNYTPNPQTFGQKARTFFKNNGEMILAAFVTSVIVEGVGAVATIAVDKATHRNVAKEVEIDV